MTGLVDYQTDERTDERTTGSCGCVDQRLRTYFRSDQGGANGHGCKAAPK